MAYIKQVKDTANQKFNLHDPRLDTGEGINIIKDWLSNDPESSQYIKNRTHYENNRFESVHPNWNGVFTTGSEVPKKIELSGDYILYKVSNIPFTDTITANTLKDIIVYYNPTQGVAVSNQTIQELFPNDTLNIDLSWVDSITQKVQQIIYGVFDNGAPLHTITLFNVTEEKEVEIKNTNVKLKVGIYALGNPGEFNNNEDIRPIRYPNEIVKIDKKYIPTDLVLDNYYSQTQINVDLNEIRAAINTKMDKENPSGTGNFVLLKDINNLGGSITVAGDVYTQYTVINYWILVEEQNQTLVYQSKTLAEVEQLEYPIVEVINLPQISDAAQGVAYKQISKCKVATEDYVTNALADKMDANTTLFSDLYVGTVSNNSRVATVEDLDSLPTPVRFRGIFTTEANYWPNGIDGDYLYYIAAYTSGGSAEVTKYVYDDSLHNWVSTGDTMTRIFSNNQWKNINTNYDNEIQQFANTIQELYNKVIDLEDICGTMFESAEGKEF